MAIYIARIELRDRREDGKQPEKPDYTKLSKDMFEISFTKGFTIGTTTEYQLPSDTYLRVSNDDMDSIEGELLNVLRHIWHKTLTFYTLTAIPDMSAMRFLLPFKIEGA